MPKKVIQGQQNQEQLALSALDYLHAKEVEKTAKKQIEQLKVPLEEFLKSNGTKASSGSIYVEIPYNGSTIQLEHRYRGTQVQKEGAVEKLKSLGLENCVEYKPIVNIDMVMSALDNGLITKQDIQELFEEKASYALYVNNKK